MVTFSKVLKQLRSINQLKLIYIHLKKGGIFKGVQFGYPFPTRNEGKLSVNFLKLVLKISPLILFVDHILVFFHPNTFMQALSLHLALLTGTFTKHSNTAILT